METTSNNKDTYKSIGEIVEDAAQKTTTDAQKFVALSISKKLADLEDRWEEAVGVPLARKSSPVLFEYDEDIWKLTINVVNGAILSSARLRTVTVERKISRILEHDRVKVKFKVGPVTKGRAKNSFVPMYKRRAPVVLDENDVLAQQTEFEKSGMSKELAANMARIKLSLERLFERKQN